MNLYKSDTWISDLDTIIERITELDFLCGHNVLITGCTGLICSAVVDVLVRWNETHEKKINIIAAGRNKKRVEERFFPFYQREWFKYVPFDAISNEKIALEHCDYIIYGASNASPNKIIEEPVETMLSNVVGLKNILDFANKHKTKRVLFVSSSEVYGKKLEIKPYGITDYGYIDILNSRNSYSISKRAAETLCVSYKDEYGVDSVIIRPGHIYGPTALDNDNRVSSAWAYAVAQGKDILMKSDGSQIRSYCHCLDCASAMLKILLYGKTIQAYNISNPDSVISIMQMAEILTRISGVGLKRQVPTKEELKGFNPMTNSSLNAEPLLDLGWKGYFDAEQGFSHTVQVLKEMLREKEITDNTFTD